MAASTAFLSTDKRHIFDAKLNLPSIPRLECPAFCVPVLMRETGQKGADDGEGQEAYGGADRELVRQIEVLLGNGKTTPQACRETGITVQTFYRWRKEYGGLKLDQARRMKELEKENARLKRLVAELSLEKQILKDVAEGNF